MSIQTSDIPEGQVVHNRSTHRTHSQVTIDRNLPLFPPSIKYSPHRRLSFDERPKMISDLQAGPHDFWDSRHSELDLSPRIGGMLPDCFILEQACLF